MIETDPTKMTLEQAAEYAKAALLTYMTKVATEAERVMGQLTAPVPAEDDEYEIFEANDDILEYDLDDDDEEEEEEDWDEDQDEDQDEAEPPKFAVGDTVCCGVCGTGKVTEVLPANEGYNRYVIEGIGKHYGLSLTLVERAEPEIEKPAPKYKKGQFVRSKFFTMEITGEPTFDSWDASGTKEWVYPICYGDGSKNTRPESWFVGLGDMPTPAFQVGQRIDFYGEKGCVVGVHLTDDQGNGYRNYRFDLLMDSGSDYALYDYDLSRDDSKLTAHNLISREK